MTHPFQQQFESVVSELNLCEGCPGINKAQHEINELIAQDPDGLSTTDFNLNYAISSLRGLKRALESGPCKGALKRDEVYDWDVIPEEEKDELKELHQEMLKKYPWLAEQPKNVTKGGYYCEPEHRNNEKRQKNLLGILRVIE